MNYKSFNLGDWIGHISGVIEDESELDGNEMRDLVEFLSGLSKTGHCKDCKYFEHNSWAKVNGIPLIVAHEICSRWGDGCKTKEDGYCFLFEPQERSDEE